MDRRIFGLETEYGVTCAADDGRGLSADEVARYLFRKVVAWGRSSNVFLRNGSRLYLDVGSHPEYATAECDDVRQLVAHDRGGRAHPRGPRRRRPAASRARGPVRADPPVQEQHRLGRQLLRLPRELPRAAAGRLRPALGRARPVPAHPPGPHRRRQGAHDAARARCTACRSAPTTSGRRSPAPPPGRVPIINTRDEPHADAEHYRRLHVIVGDSSMSETTTMLKVGATDLVLRMVEAGRAAAGPHAGEPDPRDPRDQPRPDRQAPVHARQRADRDRRRHPGGVPRAGQGVRRAARSTPRPGSSRSLDLWERGLRALRTGDLVARRPRARLGHQVEDPPAVHGQARPAALRRPRSPGSTWPTTTSPAPRGCTTCSRRAAWSSGSPPTSRCSRRRRCRRRPPGPSCAATSCAAAQEARRDYTVDWVHLKLNDQAQRTVLCKDPFRSVDERVERLIESM